MKGQSEAKLLNVYGNVKVLNLSHIIKSRKFYNTQCLKCNKESIRRIDHLKTFPQYCKFCKDKLSSNPKVESVIHSLYCGYRSNAKTRGLEFNLSKEKFTIIIGKNCYYCGEPPKETGSSKLFNRTDTIFLHNGIDRIDSSKTYDDDNIIPCCGICNRMKNKFSQDIFFDKIKKIYDKHLKECSTTIPKGSTSQANGDGNRKNPLKDCDIV